MMIRVVLSLEMTSRVVGSTLKGIDKVPVN